MRSIVFRFSIYASLTILVLAAINVFIVNKYAGYDAGEVAGYLTMLLSMIFVFTGIRHYRDYTNQGALTFAQGMKVGALIVLIPSVCFGLFDVLYTEVINPQWTMDYFNYYMNEVRRTLPPERAGAELKKLQMQKEMFDNPLIQFVLMAATVFVIGMIVTIISSLALRRKKVNSII